MNKPKLYYRVRRWWFSNKLVRKLRLNGWFGSRAASIERMEQEEREANFRRVKYTTIRHMVKLLGMTQAEATEAVEQSILRAKRKGK